MSLSHANVRALLYGLLSRDMPQSLNDLRLYIDLEPPPTNKTQPATVLKKPQTTINHPRMSNGLTISGIFSLRISSNIASRCSLQLDIVS
jgi:hypothetical protein